MCTWVFSIGADQCVSTPAGRQNVWCFWEVYFRGTSMEILPWRGKHWSIQSYVHRVPSSYYISFSIRMQMSYSRINHWTVEMSMEMMVKQIQYRGNEAMISTGVNKTWNLSLTSGGTSLYSLENLTKTWSWLDSLFLLAFTNKEFSLDNVEHNHQERERLVSVVVVCPFYLEDFIVMRLLLLYYLNNGGILWEKSQ